jgi:hypothetical protein
MVREAAGAGDAPRAGQLPRDGPSPVAPRTTPTRAVRFPLGRIVATPGALRALAAANADPVRYVARHASGEWGDLDADDRAANEQALRDGARLLSAYRLPDGERLWIITEADRSATTLLLPDEY